MTDQSKIIEALNIADEVLAMNNDELRLHMGECTAQELRTARAAVGLVRMRITALLKNNKPEKMIIREWLP